MTANAFRFEFEPLVSVESAELSLHLAMYAVEGLYGEARVRLDARYHLDEARRSSTVDGGTEVGAALVNVYTRLLIREFGEDGFHVRRIEPGSVETPATEAFPRQRATAPAAA